MRQARAGWIALAVVLGCDAPKGRNSVVDNVSGTPPGDSLALITPTGTEIWFTLARPATRADSSNCVERGLEIRTGDKRIKVPLLYTAGRPVLVNDSTIRAVLWTHCEPRAAYLVNLRTGQPVPERARS